MKMNFLFLTAYHVQIISIIYYEIIFLTKALKKKMPFKPKHPLTWENSYFQHFSLLNFLPGRKR